MELKIFNSILFGELRPWLNENRDDKKFSQGLIPEITNPQTPAGFKTALAKIIPAHLLEDETLKIYRQPENIQEPFIKAPIALIDAPQPNNPATRFYAHLISNEATFVISELHQVLTGDGMDELQSEYLIKELKKATVSLLKEIPKTLATQPEDDHQSRLVITILKHNLIRLLIEPELLFPHFTKVPAVHVDQIFNEYLREPAPEAPFYTVSSELFRVQMQLFFQQSAFDRNRGVDLMKKVIASLEKENDARHKEQCNKILLLLENFIFLKQVDQSQNPSLEQLTSPELINEHYTIITSQIFDELESLNGSTQKLEVIQYKEEDLSWLSEDEIQSLPRRVKNWLSIQKKFIEANLHIDPEKLKQASLPKVRTTLTVPELAYLFRALVDAKIITPRNKTDLFKGIAAVFSSKKGIDISSNSLKNKFDTPEPKAMEFWQEKFYTLGHNAKKDQEK